ncbi:carotenoid biosynthesis protein [uncultured Jatrophihabitans sp.]|uniref:carotenoid biosynthesis protein n=1 Tax=uncultured Jatrophihabitans sp. TaxID=1610747 RepID=UPI0035C987E3
MQLLVTFARRRVKATSGSSFTAVLVALAGLLIGLQIAYPVTDGLLRARITVAVVVVFATLCVLDAAASRGPRRALTMLGVTAIPGLLVEMVGVGTGVPFGTYSYTGALGPRVLDVPLLVGLAWTMLAWPAALVARRLTANRAGRVLIGAWAMTAGDLFLDPQMVSAGMWRWRDPSPHLPGVPDVPLTNLAGWLLVTVVLSALVQGVIGDGADTLGIAMYVWLWVGWTVALGVFLHLPAAAGWGALAMGSVAIPVLARVAEQRRVEQRREPVGMASW